MSLSPPLKELNIKMEDSGFYDGFNRIVILVSKALLAVVVLFCLVFPETAGNTLNTAKNWSFNYLNWYYIFSVALFICTCIILAVVPSFGRVKLGVEGDKTEFSTFSWFSMMFGAGIGIGMLGYAAGEPLFHFANNPEIIKSKQAILVALGGAGVPPIQGRNDRKDRRHGLQFCGGNIDARL